MDTNTVLSALLFPRGRLAWLESAWMAGQFIPLMSQETAQELLRALAYPKFRLDEKGIEVLLSAYLPYTEVIEVEKELKNLPICRDRHDQMFVALAAAGKADVLVSGDKAILELASQPVFAIETPAQFKKRFFPEN
ncbi:MAG: putative toxin-antitoxin system toxin component, PIN family [Candidatus Binatia bacterium]